MRRKRQVLCVRRSNTKVMNTGLKLGVGDVQRQVAGRTTGKTNIARGVEHLDILSMTVHIFTIARSSELRNCPTRECDPGGFGGNSLDWKEGLTKLNKFVYLFVCLSPGQKNIAGQDTNSDKFRWCQGYFDAGNSISESVSLGRQWLLGNRYTGISLKWGCQGIWRRGELESGAQTPRNPIGRPEPMEIEFKGKFLLSLDRKNNFSLVFSSHVGGGLERVDTSINMTSREWRLGGAPTND